MHDNTTSASPEIPNTPEIISTAETTPPLTATPETTAAITPSPTHPFTQVIQALGFPDGQWIEMRVNTHYGWHSTFHATADDLIAAISPEMIRSMDIYFAVCPRYKQDKSKAGVNTVPALWVDIDLKGSSETKEDVIARLRGLKCPPTVIIDSGHGVHAYWTLIIPFQVNNDADVREIEGVLAGLIDRLGADPACKDISRILRVPDTMNLKDPVAEVRLIDLCPERRYPLETFRRNTPTPTPTSPTDYAFEGTISTSPLSLLSGLEEGNRHTSFLKVAGSLIGKGYSSDDAFELLRASAEASGFPLEELESITSSLYEHQSSENQGSLPLPSLPTSIRGGSDGAGNPPLECISFKDYMSGEDDPVAWAVECLIPAQGAGILAGLGFIGKSWIIMDLGIEVSRGGIWIDRFACNKRPVVFVDRENQRGLVRARFRKLCKAKELDPANDLDIHFVRGDRFALDDPQTYHWLRGVLAAHRGSLVLIDSLIRVHSGDENSSRDMAKVSNVVLSLAREFDCFILFTDHLGKTPRGLGANLRGTTEKFAFCDAVIEGEATPDKTVRLTVSKLRGSNQEPEPFEIRIVDPIPGVSTALEYVEPSAQDVYFDRQEQVRDFLEATLKGKGWLHRQAIIEAGKPLKLGEKAISNALKRLSVGDNRAIEMREDWNDATNKRCHLYRWFVAGQGNMI